MEDFEEMMKPSLRRASRSINSNIKWAAYHKLFIELPTQDMVTVTFYVKQWGKHELDQVEWEILKDEDKISWDMPTPDP
jgi:hypothetical protein